MDAKSTLAARQLTESTETVESLVPVGVVRIEDVEDDW